MLDNINYTLTALMKAEAWKIPEGYTDVFGILHADNEANQYNNKGQLTID